MSTKSNQEKLWASAVRAFVVLFLFSPPLFSITAAFLRIFGIDSCSGGCPTLLAIIIHAIVFFVLDYYLMNSDKPESDGN